MRNKIFILSAILIILALAYFFLKPTSSNFQTTTVIRSDITDTVSQSGNVIAASQSDIFATSTGIISEIYVKNGDVLMKGDIILKIQSTSTDQTKSLAKSNLFTAKNTLQNTRSAKTTAQATLEAGRKAILDAAATNKTLDDNLGSGKNNINTGKPYTQEEIDSIRSTLTSARQNFNALEQKYLDSDSAIAAAQSALIAAQDAFNATQDAFITAPINGTLSNFNLSIGTNTTATSAQSTGTLIAKIANFSSYTISTNINETNRPNIQIDQPVEIIFDALPNLTYIGRISKIDDIGKPIQGLVSYVTEIQITNPDESIKSGMTASLSISTATKNNVLTIPTGVLHTQNQTKGVYVLQNNQAIFTAITTGLTGKGKIEVVSGLTDSDQIITNYKP